MKKKTMDRPQELVGPKSRVFVKNNLVKRMGVNQKVRFYPSGSIPVDIGADGVWIKYKRTNTNNKVTVLNQAAKWVHMDTPDRELLLVRNCLELDQDAPIGMGWDRYVSLSPFHATGDDHVNDRMLINPENFDKFSRSQNFRINKIGYTNRIMLADSGGFQLRSGISEFIDPEALAEWYSGNADEGMALDIPCSGKGAELMTECAHVQIANSKFLKANTDKAVTLSNVIHGVEIPDMKLYRRIIEEADPDWKIVSIPSSMPLPPLKQLDRMAFLMSTGAQYGQYHMLGLYNLGSMCLITRLVHKLSKAGREVLVTSDAATAYYSAKWRVYHTNMTHYDSVNRNLIGTITPGGISSNQFRTLPCSCEICSSIKYMDVLSHLNHRTANLLTTRHNEINYINWLTMLNQYAFDLNDEDYRELVLAINGPALQSQMKEGLNYIDHLLEHGYTKTHARYRHQTSFMFHPPQQGIDTREPEIPEDKLHSEIRIKKAVKRYKAHYGLA